MRSGNWIKFDNQPIRPWKSNIQAGDLPEILIEPVTSINKQASDSLSAEVQITWSIKCATGDVRFYWDDVNNPGNWTGVFPMKWAILLALDSVGDALASPNSSPALPSLTFCRVSRITAEIISPFDAVGNPVSEGRGTDGWTILTTFVTTLDLPRVNGVLQLPNG